MMAKVTALIETPYLGGQFTGLTRIGGVTDIVVNGYRQVWADCGCGLVPVLSPFTDDAEVKREAIRLAALARRRLDDGVPIADGVVGNIRFHAVLPPLADAPLVSLRILGQTRLQLPRMIRAGSLSRRMRSVATALIEKRWNVVVSGATGAGKTTVLGALLSLVAADQRIVCIEEVSELSPHHPHVVSLRERAANVQGRGG